MNRSCSSWMKTAIVISPISIENYTWRENTFVPRPRKPSTFPNLPPTPPPPKNYIYPRNHKHHQDLPSNRESHARKPGKIGFNGTRNQDRFVLSCSTGLVIKAAGRCSIGAIMHETNVDQLSITVRCTTTYNTEFNQRIGHHRHRRILA